MHNVQETQNTISKQTVNIVFATSIYAILIDFAFESSLWHFIEIGIKNIFPQKPHVCQKCLYEVLTCCHRYTCTIQVHWLCAGKY